VSYNSRKISASKSDRCRDDQVGGGCNAVAVARMRCRKSNAGTSIAARPAELGGHRSERLSFFYSFVVSSSNAGVAELADATDLKSDATLGSGRSI
jgi:hypothetical protein